MRSTGIRRKVDDLGRVVIPVGIRRSLGIDEGSELDVAVDGDRIVLAKPQDACVFCGDDREPLQIFRERRICPGCLAEVAALDDPRRGVPPHPFEAAREPAAPSPADPDDATGSERVSRYSRPREGHDPASTTAW